MVIPPEAYYNAHKDMKIEELIIARDELIKDIRRFEKNKLTMDEIYTKPSPETFYEFNNMYLIKITELILLTLEEERQKLDDEFDME